MTGEVKKRIRKFLDKNTCNSNGTTIEESKYFLEVGLNKIVDEACKDRPKPFLTQDYGYPERECKYWVIPTHKDWMKWFKEQFGDEK